MSSVRGIGVAVMTSTSVPALSPFDCSDKPLVHAEAVLLVDDGEGEVAEDDVRLEQRVRADKDVDLARGQTLEQRPCAARLSRGP